jgi:hypothetical protein
VTTSSYATAGIAPRVSGALKSHHHDKVETPYGGEIQDYHHVKKVRLPQYLINYALKTYGGVEV